MIDSSNECLNIRYAILNVSNSKSVYIYIYIYIYREREREREREGGSK